MWPFSRKTETRASPEDPRYSVSDPRVLSVIFGQADSESGETVTADTALKVPAIWGAVSFLSGTIASLPLQVYRRTDDGREVDKRHPAYPLIHDSPNPEWSSYRWRKYVMNRVLLQGRGYTFIERNAARRPMALWPLQPSRVTVESRDGRTRYRYRRDDQQEVVYQADEILDIPFLLGDDQLSSVSPVERLRDVIGLSLALQRFAARHFKNGGVPPLVLEGPQMSPAAGQRAGEDVKSAIQKAIQEGRPPAIPEGYTLKPLGIDPEKSQMEASRRFQLEEIARIYSLPPTFLQDLTHGTFSNTEQQDLHFVKHTLTQWLKAWESEFNLKLFSGRNRTHFAEFNVDGLLRGDFKTRMDGYARAIQNSIRKPNEVRELENLPPAEGGDKLYLQQNMSQLQLLDDMGMPVQE